MQENDKTGEIHFPDIVSMTVDNAIANQMAIKEHFIAQYLAKTGAKIEDTVLVEQRSRDGLTFRYWCEPKMIRSFNW